MSEGRHHLFQHKMYEGRHRLFHHFKEDDDNINLGYADQGSYGSSDNQAGSGYNAGSDYYNAGNDHQTGSCYNFGNDYQIGYGYNIIQRFYICEKESSGYNADWEYNFGSRVNADSGYGGDCPYQQDQSEDYDRAQQEVKGDKGKEQLGEFGAGAAGGYALHEKHEAKKDPGNARRHKIEEEVAAAAAVGGGGYAFHEHHD